MNKSKKRRRVSKIVVVAPLALLVLVGILWVNGRGVSEDSQVSSCVPQDFSGEFNSDKTMAFFEGKNIPVYLAKSSQGGKRVLGAVTSRVGERWVEVDLSEQKLRAWEGDKLFLETLISSGLPWTPTPEGEFRIWTKMKYTRMEGGQGKYYYNLPNVPFVMFFSNNDIPGWKGYGLHGTYWHHDFGKPHSHGCVNLPTDVAEQLFYWTTPDIEASKGVVKADEEDLGTRIVIHE